MDERTRAQAYAFVAATTLLAFIAYGVFTTVTVVVYTKAAASKPEIVVLSFALAKSEALRGCFIAYAVVDLALRAAWTWEFDRGGGAVRWVRAACFLLNPVFQILTAAITMYADNAAHMGMAATVVVTYFVYALLGAGLHVARACRGRAESSLVYVGIAAEAIAVGATAAAAGCYMNAECVAAPGTHAWYEYVIFTFVALMGFTRAIDVATLRGDYAELGDGDDV